MPLKTGRDNRKMIKDVVRFRSLTSEIVTPNDIPPIPDKLPADFFELIRKCHELQLSKHVGSTKTSWDPNLRMIFSRWKQVSDLITNEAKNLTRFHKSTDQIISEAKKFDEDRLRLAISLSKPKVSLSAYVTRVKLTSTTYQKIKSNQNVPKPRKFAKLKDPSNC